MGVAVETGGKKKGAYLLTFAKGKVRMELTLKDGKVYQLTFKGDRRLARRLKSFSGGRGALRVQAFSWIHEGDRPGPERFRAGEKIRFKLQLSGLRRQGNSVRARVGMSVIDAVGKVVVDKPSFAEIETKSSAVTTTVRGALGPLAPGRYRVELGVTDLKSKGSLDLTRPVTIEGAPTSRKANPD